jgi:FlaA1/EpsC-like NDP-sugar epimerase
MTANAIFFVLFRTMRGILRYSTFRDLLQVVYALTFGYVLAFILANTVFSQYIESTFPRFFTMYVVNICLMFGFRIVVKETYDSLVKARENNINVFVYGTKATGISLARSFKSMPDMHYNVKGFISNEKEMVGKEFLGARVYLYDENIYRILESMDVRTVIISPQKMEDLKGSDTLNEMIDNGLTLLTTPPLSEWKGELTTQEQIKELKIEDLLPRAPIHINMQNIANHIEGKRVMVTGAAGSIGSEIVRQVAAFNPFSIILVDQAETPLHDMRLEMMNNWVEVNTECIVADISNKTRMEDVFIKYKPQYIFHAAAYKHVPMMEDNVSESIQNNVLGTKTLADLAVRFKTDKFVMISTDKAVNPSNVMGCSKRICEIYVQSLAKELERKGMRRTQFITTRFGNVLGSNGSVIPLFREQIRKGGPVTVTHPEIIRYFMTIPEACQLVLEAGSMGKGGEIYLFDMGKPVKILDLAKRMIRLSGSYDVKIEFTGLRHGEKLYEELLNTKENTKPTHHEKIMIANVQEYDYQVVKDQIDSLIATSYDFDDMSTVSIMKQIVPEFKSINSPFESLDQLQLKKAII